MAADSNALTNKIRGFLGLSNSADDLDTLDAARTATQNAARVPELEATNATLTSERDTARTDLAAANARIEAMEQAEDERLLNDAVASFKIKAADRDEYAGKLAENRAQTRATLAALPENGQKPGRPSGGVQAPDDAKNGEPVTLTRAEARIPKAYNEARAKAKKLGVGFEIID